MFNGAKRMTCTEVRDILSDLIDVRNGEIPPVGVSRLSEPEVRADAESHLASCADCRVELVILEEVGSVFSDFNVGELPTQHFANYGQVVRDRMAKNDRKITPIRASFAKQWWRVAASTAAAACIAFAVMHFVPKKAKSQVVTTIPPKIVRPYKDTPIPLIPLNPTGNSINDGVNLVNQGFEPQVREQMHQSKVSLNELLEYEKKFGSVALTDTARGNEGPLLGAVIKTIRDQDRDLTKIGSLGLRVYDIVPDSVANEMGLMKGDTIVCINGLNVNSGGVEDAVKFITAIANLGKGAAVTIDIVREDRSGVLYIQRRGVLGQPKAVFE